MPRQKFVETGPGQTQEIAVADREDRCRTRLAGQQRHLADGAAATDLLEHALAPVGVEADHAQAAVDDHVGMLATVPLAEQRLPAGQVHPFEAGFDLAQRRGIERAEQFGEQFRQLVAAHPRQQAVQESAQRLGMPGCESLEIGPAEARQARRFDRDHRRRARLPGEQRHLADDGAGADVVQRRRRSIGVRDADGQPPR